MEVRDAVQQFIRDKHNENPGKWEKERAGHLAVSVLGHCPRKALSRIAGAEATNAFGDYVQEVMRAGIVWEVETERSRE